MDLIEINDDICKSKNGEVEIPLVVVGKDEPYLKVAKVRKYNKEYGDNRICKCGRSYYRHFDPYEEMLAVECKYCGFEEENIKVGDTVEIISEDITKGRKAKVVDNDSEDKDFKVSFDAGWQGYYMKNQIRKIQ